MPATPAAIPQTSATPSGLGRTLLIHGYSADATALQLWKQKLEDAKIPTLSIDVGNYITLNNEVTIKDLGEAFDRALRHSPWGSGSKDDQWTFDAIVHSTGMLVLRQWLASDPYDRDDPRSRIKRLKHLVGLAPATFGSPQGKKGRSWLGSLIKGNRHLGPDFLNAGDQVLDGLELGSRFTWELAHKDMICGKPLYDKGSGTPYVAVFIGNRGYDGVSSLANSPGADGTVRWAGAALNSRKISIDFRREPRLQDDAGNLTRVKISPWENDRLGAPIIAVEGQNHSSIIAAPSDVVLNLMTRFFAVSDEAAYMAWQKDATAAGTAPLQNMNRSTIDHTQDPNDGAGWQQFVLHAVDDHGDGVTDYNLQLFLGTSMEQSDDPDYPPVRLIADTYSSDASYRCFYVRLTKDMVTPASAGAAPKMVWLELIASSGSTLIQYEAYIGDPGTPGEPQALGIDHDGGRPVKLDLTPLAKTLFFPYTTTLVELFIEREPLPLKGVSDIFKFPGLVVAPES